jgi:hypothetical protein
VAVVFLASSSALQLDVEAPRRPRASFPQLANGKKTSLTFCYQRLAHHTPKKYNDGDVLWVDKIQIHDMSRFNDTPCPQ